MEQLDEYFKGSLRKFLQEEERELKAAFDAKQQLQNKQNKQIEQTFNDWNNLQPDWNNLQPSIRCCREKKKLCMTKKRFSVRLITHLMLAQFNEYVTTMTKFNDLRKLTDQLQNVDILTQKQEQMYIHGMLSTRGVPNIPSFLWTQLKKMGAFGWSQVKNVGTLGKISFNNFLGTAIDPSTGKPVESTFGTSLLGYLYADTLSSYSWSAAKRDNVMMAVGAGGQAAGMALMSAAAGPVGLMGALALSGLGAGLTQYGSGGFSKQAAIYHKVESVRQLGSLGLTGVSTLANVANAFYYQKSLQWEQEKKLKKLNEEQRELHQQNIMDDFKSEKIFLEEAIENRKKLLKRLEIRKRQLEGHTLKSEKEFLYYTINENIPEITKKFPYMTTDTYDKKDIYMCFGDVPGTNNLILNVQGGMNLPRDCVIKSSKEKHRWRRWDMVLVLVEDGTWKPAIYIGETKSKKDVLIYVDNAGNTIEQYYNQVERGETYVFYCRPGYYLGSPVCKNFLVEQTETTVFKKRVTGWRSWDLMKKAQVKGLYKKYTVENQKRTTHERKCLLLATKYQEIGPAADFSASSSGSLATSSEKSASYRARRRREKRRQTLNTVPLSFRNARDVLEWKAALSEIEKEMIQNKEERKYVQENWGRELRSKILTYRKATFKEGLSIALLIEEMFGSLDSTADPIAIKEEKEFKQELLSYYLNKSLDFEGMKERPHELSLLCLHKMNLGKWLDVITSV